MRLTCDAWAHILESDTPVSHKYSCFSEISPVPAMSYPCWTLLKPAMLARCAILAHECSNDRQPSAEVDRFNANRQLSRPIECFPYSVSVSSFALSQDRNHPRTTFVSVSLTKILCKMTYSFPTRVGTSWHHPINMRTRTQGDSIDHGNTLRLYIPQPPLLTTYHELHLQLN